MQFKKVNNNIDNFIESATGETKKIRNRTKNFKKKLHIMVNDELLEFIESERQNTCSTKSQFIKNFIFQKNDYFTKDENIKKVFQIAMSNGISIRSLIRTKLGFDNKVVEFEYFKEKDKKHCITFYISDEEQIKINELTQAISTSTPKYIYNKIYLYRETYKLFTFEEQMQINQDLKKYDLSLEDYLIAKINF